MIKIIVIDPGHGGTDPGATGFGLKEKDLNLSLSLKIAGELLPYNCTVMLTRKEDIFLSLKERVDFANSLNAVLFLSIHTNSGGGTGFESFIYTDASSLSRKYHEIIHSKVASYLKTFNLPDRGMKTANFYVLRLTKMPAVLLENLFIDNKQDVAHLKDTAFMAGLAGAIASGVADALDLSYKEKPWDPAGEINLLIKDGLLKTARSADAYVLWGEMATVLNRLRLVPPPSPDVWDPDGEITLLMRDGIVNVRRESSVTVNWGEFATVLNRLRKRTVTAGVWNPEEEIRALITDGLVHSYREPSTPLRWGEFATVLNRYRGLGG